MPRALPRTLAAALALAVGLSPALAGDVNPPSGPVGSTMKPLDQVEPRTPVSTTTTPGTATALFRITQPGSYYLVSNLTGVASKSGIEIAASDVTLDLMGFRLVGVTGSLAGINVVGGVSNIAIRNGTIRSFAGGGIAAGSCQGCSVEEVRCIGNTGSGINLGSDAMVRRCYCASNTQSGIQTLVGAEVSECIVRANGTNGISTSDHSIASGNVAIGNTSTGLTVGAGAMVGGVITAQNGVGVSASSGLNAFNCIARGNTSHGFTVFGASFTNCEATVNTGDGFHTDAAIINGCRATSNANGCFAGNNSLVLSSLTVSNALYGVRATTGYVLNNLCTADSANQTGLLGEIYFDGRGRVDNNHLDNSNTNLWGVAGTSSTLMLRNSLGGGFVTTFSGMEAPDISSSNIDTTTNPLSNFDLP